MRALAARYIFGKEGVKELELRISNSRVMGSHAVTVTAAVMAVTGAGQLLGLGGSAVLSQFGGAWLDLMWSWMLVVAFFLVLAARWREAKDAIDAAWLEIGGILLIAVVFILFTGVVIAYTEGGGALFLTCAFVAQTLNMLGRGMLLLRRIIWLERAHT